MDSDSLPVRYDVTICAGASWVDQFEILDEDDESGLVSGSTARLRVWNPYTDEVYLDFTTAGGQLVIDADAGTIDLVTVPADTEDLVDLEPDELVARMDLRVTLPNGQVIVYVAGNATIYQGPST